MLNKKLMPSVLVLALITGCQTANLTKEEIGKYTSITLGTIIGASVVDDNKWLAAAIGGTATYFAGQMIGKYLDDQERKELAAKTVYSLDEVPSGSSNWKSDRNNSSAQIKTGDVTYTSHSKDIQHLKAVETVPNIKLEKREYKTTSALKVRSGPGTRYSRLSLLRAGDVVISSGRTDNNWLMLTKQGITVGYVSADYVKPYNPIEQAKAHGIDLDSVDITEVPKQTAFGGIDLDTVETVSSTITAKTGCRDVQISVSTSKGTETETTQACQQNDGVWELG